MLPNPPLVVGLGRRTLTLPDGPREVEARARLFEYGAASIVLAVPVPAGTMLDALTPTADRLYDGPEVNALALELVEGLRRAVAPAMENPHLWTQVENSLKIIGDFYLARVYESAVEQLRIPAWKASVTRKVGMLGDVYGWLKGEVDTARSLTLEVMIVVLIVLELLVAAGSLFQR